ncbi:MAG: hypothetical protein HN348_27540, partial [Proteobacteria bacterium]|nr:hypothetical protein [Pseudomonadota bacterium]
GDIVRAASLNELSEDLPASLLPILEIAERLEDINDEMSQRFEEHPGSRIKREQKEAIAFGDMANFPKYPKEYGEIKACAEDFKAKTGSDELLKMLPKMEEWTRFGASSGWRVDLLDRMSALIIDRIQLAKAQQSSAGSA